MDVDSDDVIEIPELHLMPGYEWSEIHGCTRIRQALFHSLENFF